MMHMTFYWSKEVTLLVDTWKTTGWLSYSLTLIACLVTSAFYQYLENRRLRLKMISSSPSAAAVDSPSVVQPLLLGKLSGGKLTASRVAGAVLFGINSGIGYLLMLAVMSFNGGVFFSVVMGLAVGYFCFRSGDEDLKLVENSCACA